MSATFSTKRKSSISFIAKISILGALSCILMLFEFPIPIAPPFYELDFSEVVVLIGGFALAVYEKYQKIFFKKTKEKFKQEHPEVAGSKGWDGACERIASWVKLRDKVSGKEYFALNTHLDHVIGNLSHYDNRYSYLSIRLSRRTPIEQSDH